MSPDVSMETKVTLRQAFLVMHAYLSLHYALRGNHSRFTLGCTRRVRPPSTALGQCLLSSK